MPDCEKRGALYDVRLGDARLTLDRELANNCDELRRAGARRLQRRRDSRPLADRGSVQDLSWPPGEAKADGRDGAIAVHITNRYVDLEPIVRGAAERFDLKTARIQTKRDNAQAIYSSDWMILTNQSLLDELADAAVPADEHPKPAVLWTDSRSNLFDALK